MKKVKDILKSDRPREKLLQKGAEALSDIELIAILLGSGSKGLDVMTVAERILKVLDAHNEKLNLDELKKTEGVGPAKATLIAAAMEFVRRRIRPEGLKISFPADVLPLIAIHSDISIQLSVIPGLTRNPAFFLDSRFRGNDIFVSD